MNADYTIENHGSLFIFRAENDEALENLRENVQEDAQWWGKGVVVEPRYAHELAVALELEGWTVE